MNDNDNIIKITDEEGNEYLFEELDRIEDDNGNKFIALIPADDSDTEAELIVLKVLDDSENPMLEAIEDEEEYEEIASIFIERLAEFYDIEN